MSESENKSRKKPGEIVGVSGDRGQGSLFRNAKALRIGGWSTRIRGGRGGFSYRPARVRVT